MTDVDSTPTAQALKGGCQACREKTSQGTTLSPGQAARQGVDQYPLFYILTVAVIVLVGCLFFATRVRRCRQVSREAGEHVSSLMFVLYGLLCADCVQYVRERVFSRSGESHGSQNNTRPGSDDIESHDAVVMEPMLGRVRANQRSAPDLPPSYSFVMNRERQAGLMDDANREGQANLNEATTIQIPRTSSGDDAICEERQPSGDVQNMGVTIQGNTRDDSSPPHERSPSPTPVRQGADLEDPPSYLDVIRRFSMTLERPQGEDPPPYDSLTRLATRRGTI